MNKILKKYFLSGLVFIIPIVLTGFLVYFIINKIGGVWFTLFANIPYMNNLPVFVINIIGLIISFLFIIIIGYLGTNIIGKFFISVSEKIIIQLPFIKNIYSSAKELTYTLFLNKSSFNRVVFVKMFSEDKYTVAFVTSEKKWTIDNETALTLFVPTSPNPTSGFFVIVPESNVIETNITVEEGLKLIVSSGMVFNKQGIINDKKN